MDVLSQTEATGQNALKLFDYQARAQMVAGFELDITPFGAVKDQTLADILSESRDQLIQMTRQPEAEIEQLKSKLAQLSSALDNSTVKRLTLVEVG